MSDGSVVRPFRLFVAQGRVAEGVQVGGVGRRCGSECRGLGVRQRECRGCCGWRCRARVVVLASGEVVGSRPVCRFAIKFTCRDASVPRRRDAWRVRVAAWSGSCGVLSVGTGADVCGCRPAAIAAADPTPAYAGRVRHGAGEPQTAPGINCLTPSPSASPGHRMRRGQSAVTPLRPPPGSQAGRGAARSRALFGGRPVGSCWVTLRSV